MFRIPVVKLKLTKFKTHGALNPSSHTRTVSKESFIKLLAGTEMTFTSE